MNRFWAALGFLALALVVGVLPLLAMVLLVAAVYAVISKTAESGLNHSVEAVKSELQRQPDPEKAKALQGFLGKMEEHQAIIHVASLTFVVTMLFIVGHPAVLLVWLIWMVAWRVLARIRTLQA